MTVRGVDGWRGILPGAVARAGAVQAAYVAETEALAAARAERTAAARAQRTGDLRPATPRKPKAPAPVAPPRVERCYLCGLTEDHAPLLRIRRTKLTHAACYTKAGGRLSTVATPTPPPAAPAPSAVDDDDEIAALPSGVVDLLNVHTGRQDRAVRQRIDPLDGKTFL